MRILYVHIGPQKTGSSSIQTFCKSNVPLLKSKNIDFHYSSENLTPTVRACFQPVEKNSFYIAKYNIDNFEKYKAKSLTFLTELFIANERNDFLLSAEGLSTFSAKEATRFLEFALKSFQKIVIIAFVREHVDWCLSSVSQAVKSGLSVKSYVSNLKVISYQKVHDNWDNGYESVKLKFVPYQNSSQEGVIPRFLELLGFDVASKNFSESVERDNKKLGGLATLLLSKYNEEVPLMINSKVNPRRKINDFLIFQNFYSDWNYSFNEETLEKIAEQTASDKLFLAEKFNIDFEEDRKQPESLSLSQIMFEKELL